MNENETSNADAPEGGDGSQTLVDRDGNRVELNESQKALLGKHWTQRLGAANAKPAEKTEGTEPEGQETQQQEPQPGAEGHDLEVPAETPQQFYEETEANVQQASMIAAELGVPREEAQGLVDYAVGLAVSDPSGVNLEDRDACMVVLSNRYGGDETAKIVEAAQKAVTRLGPKAAKFLDSTGLGNSPAVVAALAAYERGDLRLSPEKAQAALTELTKDPRGAYRNANHSGHKAAMDRANLLYQIIAKGDAKKESQPAAKKSALPSPTNAKKASLERELQSAINDPDYRKGGPKHAAAVARVEALYREMFPGNRNENGEDE